MRSLTKPIIGIIANSTSLENRADLVQELGGPVNGFFKSLKFTFQDLRGEIVPLDIQPHEILEKSGFEKAKCAMFKAVAYLVDQGAKVICFTASTKRLPGKFGQDIKKLYPDIIFTIGDNATMISFTALMDYFLSKLDKEKDLVACIGAGFLGEQAINTFLRHNFKNIVLLSEQKIDHLPSEVVIVNSFAKLPANIKLMTGCTHKHRIDPHTFKNLFAEVSAILDVSVPHMVSPAIFKELSKKVERFDGGDFYLPHVNYEFDPHILRFPGPHFWFGCFTEAIMLTLAYVDGYKLEHHNFFEINAQNQGLLDVYLRRNVISVPLINFFSPDKMETIPF